MIRKLAIYLGAIVVGLLAGLFSQAAVAAHVPCSQQVAICASDRPHVSALDVADTSELGPSISHPGERLQRADAVQVFGASAGPACGIACAYHAKAGLAATDSATTFDCTVDASGPGAVDTADLSLQPSCVAANTGSKLLPKVDNAFRFPGAGRSGAGVKNFVGPPDTIARGASPGRVFVTDEQGAPSRPD